MTARQLIEKLLTIDNLDNELHLVYENINGRVHQISNVCFNEWTWDTVMDIEIYAKESKIKDE